MGERERLGVEIRVGRDRGIKENEDLGVPNSIQIRPTVGRLIDQQDPRAVSHNVGRPSGRPVQRISFIIGLLGRSSN